MSSTVVKIAGVSTLLLGGYIIADSISALNHMRKISANAPAKRLAMLHSLLAVTISVAAMVYASKDLKRTSINDIVKNSTDKG